MNSISNLKISTGKQNSRSPEKSPEKLPEKPKVTPEIKNSESLTDTNRTPTEMGSIDETKPFPIGGLKDWPEPGKPIEKSDLVESGKSSICRGSTSTDLSDESSYSTLSSTISKPHKSNDSRWEAIQAVRSKDGVLGLNHFRLLKRLGCGDIGSVYLCELTGTKCYFAMKVMDKVTLEGRNKLLRAQTEREILQSLDHPFLPSLYTHFETEKFSCLVMEFCPGGDLHMLRQRQPAKRFCEQAVK